MTLWSGDVRIMRSPPRDAVTNMALDEAMLRTATETGATLLRIYSWDRPTVSFGRNQRCEGIYSAERCEALGVPAVRRLTGGRALLHAREVTYAVAAPTAAASSLRGGYDAINAMLLDALHRLGVQAHVALPARRTATPGLAPCFESPSGGELVVGAQKLVGSAQHRAADAFLQHGSILLDDDQGVLTDLALVPLPPVPPPATLRGCLGRVTHDMVADAITDAVGAASPRGAMATSDDLIAGIHVLTAATRYRDPYWTWRR